MKCLTLEREHCVTATLGTILYLGLSDSCKHALPVRQLPVLHFPVLHFQATHATLRQRYRQTRTDRQLMMAIPALHCVSRAVKKTTPAIHEGCFCIRLFENPSSVDHENDISEVNDVKFYCRSGDFKRRSGFRLPNAANRFHDAKSRRRREFARDVELPGGGRPGTGSSMAVADQRRPDRRQSAVGPAADAHARVLGTAERADRPVRRLVLVRGDQPGRIAHRVHLPPRGADRRSAAKRLRPRLHRRRPTGTGNGDRDVTHASGRDVIIFNIPIRYVVVSPQLQHFRPRLSYCFRFRSDPRWRRRKYIGRRWSNHHRGARISSNNRVRGVRRVLEEGAANTRVGRGRYSVPGPAVCRRGPLYSSGSQAPTPPTKGQVRAADLENDQRRHHSTTRQAVPRHQYGGGWSPRRPDPGPGPPGSVPGPGRVGAACQPDLRSPGAVGFAVVVRLGPKLRTAAYV